MDGLEAELLRRYLRKLVVELGQSFLAFAHLGQHPVECFPLGAKLHEVFQFPRYPPDLALKVSRLVGFFLALSFDQLEVSLKIDGLGREQALLNLETIVPLLLVLGAAVVLGGGIVNAARAA